MLQHCDHVHDPGLLPALQARRLEHPRSDAAGCVRHVPGALSDRALAAILDVRLRLAGDRQSARRLRAHGVPELGCDDPAPEDPGREPRAVASPQLDPAPSSPPASFPWHQTCICARREACPKDSARKDTAMGLAAILIATALSLTML